MTKTLRELHEAATPAPWVTSAGAVMAKDEPEDSDRYFSAEVYGDNWQVNVPLIAAMRNALPLLLDVVDAAREVMNYPRGERDLYATNTLVAALAALDGAA